jgi:hypothetical protein
MELTTAQRFEMERMGRAIEATTDIQAPQGMCRQLLHAWQVQRAATVWAMRQTLPRQQNAPTAETAGAPVVTDQ